MNIPENPTVAATSLILLELQKERNFRELDAGIGEFLATIEQMVADFFAQNPDDAPCACHSGCQWCCGFKTLAFPFEIVRIVEHLNASLPADARASLIQRIDKIHKLTHDLSPKQRVKLKLFCPLLIKGACVAYPVRPMSCRAYLSTDAKACQRGFYNPNKDRVDQYSYAIGLYACVKEGFEQGFRAFNIDSQPGELIGMLRQGLQTPELSARWLKGRKVFT